MLCRVLHGGSVLSPLWLISCPSALLCGFWPPWPSFPFLMHRISVPSYSRSSQLRVLHPCSVPNRNSAQMAIPRGVFCESSACLGSRHVALYSSVLILCDSSVSILLASLWAPGGQESCLPCSSLCPPMALLSLRHATDPQYIHVQRMKELLRKHFLNFFEFLKAWSPAPCVLL